MVAICVDVHPIQLYGLKNSVRRALPDCRVYVFTETREAIACVMKYGCDVLLCEIELYNGNGIQLAEEIQKLNPRVNIIFVTVCDEREHARDVLRLKPSGYLTKPASREKVARELQNLRYPVLGR